MNFLMIDGERFVAANNTYINYRRINILSKKIVKKR